jgi:hypothetical protein
MRQHLQSQSAQPQHNAVIQQAACLPAAASAGLKKTLCCCRLKVNFHAAFNCTLQITSSAALKSAGLSFRMSNQRHSHDLQQNGMARAQIQSHTVLHAAACSSELLNSCIACAKPDESLTQHQTDLMLCVHTLRSSGVQLSVLTQHDRC